MKYELLLKGTRDRRIIEGERIDILDFNMNGEDFVQIRVFKKGFSKSEYIKKDLIIKIKEKN